MWRCFSPSSSFVKRFHPTNRALIFRASGTWKTSCCSVFSMRVVRVVAVCRREPHDVCYIDPRSAALPSFNAGFNMIMIMGGESMSVRSITPHIPKSHMKLEYGRCFDIGWLLLLYVCTYLCEGTVSLRGNGISEPSGERVRGRRRRRRPYVHLRGRGNYGNFLFTRWD